MPLRLRKRKGSPLSCVLRFFKLQFDAVKCRTSPEHADKSGKNPGSDVHGAFTDGRHPAPAFQRRQKPPQKQRKRHTRGSHRSSEWGLRAQRKPRPGAAAGAVVAGLFSGRPGRHRNQARLRSASSGLGDSAGGVCVSCADAGRSRREQHGAIRPTRSG